VRYLAMVNIATGLVNLALSALLIKPFGLVGVAVGTLVPIAILVHLLLFPPRAAASASRRSAFRQAVWPAAWPAPWSPAAHAVEPVHPDGTATSLVEAAAAALLYVALFVVAVGRRDRATTPRGSGSWQGAAIWPAAWTVDDEGVILAAGKGSRLNGTAGDKPKCLVEVGETDADRAADPTLGAPASTTSCGVGCQADACAPAGRAYVRREFRFAETNSLYSLWTARALLYGVRGAEL
jgi:hypothetical protein